MRFTPEIEAFYESAVKNARSTQAVAQAVLETAQKFIPLYDASIGGLNEGLAAGKANCVGSWKFAAHLAERHGGLQLLGFFNIYSETPWSPASSTHAKLILRSELDKRFVVLEPSPHYGYVNDLEDMTSTEYAHHQRLQEQVDHNGYAIGSAAWIDSTTVQNRIVATTASTALVKEGVGSFEEPLVPVGVRDPSVVLGYTASWQCVSDTEQYTNLLSGRPLNRLAIGA